MTSRRPGGRSARVRAAVLDATCEVLAERGPGGITVAEVAQRAGVNPTSIYRRWGGPEALIVEVEVERLTRNWPVPDTGTLRGDLAEYARRAAASMDGPDGLAFLRAVLATADREHTDVAREFLRQRGQHIQAMLDRAVERGEPRLDYDDVLDVILAPIYLRRMFGRDWKDEGYLDDLVERLLSGRHSEGKNSADALRASV